jgi:parallel beta-helix repeat protein
MMFQISVKANPDVIYVPDDYEKIQWAIGNASTGDTIHVRTGIYHENVRITKSLTLVGENRDTIIDSGGEGTVISVDESDVEVSEFTIRNGSIGIMLLFWSWGALVDNNLIYNNTIIDNHFGILVSRSCGNVFRNNTMANNTYTFGVWGSSLSHFIQDIDTSNTIDGKPSYYLLNESNITISSDLFPDIGYLGLVNSTNILVKGLKLENNRQGILFAHTTNSIIENVTLSNNSYGLELFEAFNNTIKDSNITCTFGVYLESSHSNTISNNHIADGRGTGIQLDYSNHNTITKNMIVDNFGGIELELSNYNNIFHNNFIDNKFHARVSFLGLDNKWDNGYPSGGNYWNDYRGVDLYSGLHQNETSYDWIGDTSYTIIGNGQDNYPLMHPFVSEMEEMRIAYRSLLLRHIEMQSDLNALNSTLYELQEIINSLNLTCTVLQGQIDSMNSTSQIVIGDLQDQIMLLNTTLHEEIDSLNSTLQTLVDDLRDTMMIEITNIRNLLYVLTGTTLILVATTFYLVIRKPRTISKTETRTKTKTQS